MGILKVVWTVEQTLAKVKIQRRNLERNSFSPLLFVTTMIQLNYVLDSETFYLCLRGTTSK